MLASFWRVALGGIVLWAIMDRSAALTHSVRGEYGVPIAAIIVIAALVIARWLHGERPAAALRSLGLARAPARGMVAALAIAGLLALYVPLVARTASLSDGWPVTALGLFAQAGIA